MTVVSIFHNLVIEVTELYRREEGYFIMEPTTPTVLASIQKRRCEPSHDNCLNLDGEFG
jgi:hypothetical protein